MALSRNETPDTFASLPTAKPNSRFGIPFREYRRALVFMRPHWRLFPVLVCLNLLSTATALVQPFLTKLLIDEGLLRKNFRALEWFALWMGLSAALSLALGLLTTRLYTKLSAAVLFEMRLAAFQKLQRLSPQFYASTKTGEIVSRINNDIGELQRLSADTLLSIPSNLLFLVGNGAMMFYLNAKLTFIGLGLLPAAIWAMQRYQGRLRQKVQAVRESSASIGSFLIESILGMRLLITCNAQPRKDREFQSQNDTFVSGLLSMQVTSFLAGALPAGVLTLSVAALFLYGGHMVIAGALSLGSLMAFMAYHGRLLSPVQGFMTSYSALVSGSVSLSRVFELLDAPEEVTDLRDAPARAITRGAVSVENVAFHYRGRARTLDNVSFQIPDTGITMLLGPSGAGKSTITDLLMRFYDPEQGRILLDEHDLRTLRFSDLRQAVGIVEQTPFFFHCSIRENLQFAAPMATLAEMRTATGLAGIEDFISTLPEGFETIIGERGLALSAGQRQRLAIARALLRGPALLILDEPSAALDPHAEWALAQTLREIADTRAVLVVTHRAALVPLADHIVLLEHGQVAASGSPDALSAQLARHFREEVALESHA